MTTRKPYESLGNYIDGQFLKISDPNGEVISRDPGDLERPGVAFPFSFEHVHEAISSARRSFRKWKQVPDKERKKIISQYRDLLKQRCEALANAISVEIGKPLWESKLEITETCQLIDYYLKEVSQTSVELKTDAQVEQSTGTIRFLSRGIMAVITPATVPVFASHQHFIPALINGDTVILKSSKFAPYVGQCLAELAHESGMPAGVINILQGDAELGRRLVSHPEVDGVLFTGSYETAAKIKKQILSDDAKLFVMDAGGKNAMIVWDDCHYEQALHDALVASYLTTGQRCTSTSRILVHEKIFDRFLEDFHNSSKKCVVDYSLSPGPEIPFLGTLVSEEAMENYLRFQGIAVREGGEEIMRGKTLERSRKGYYVSPSIHYVERPDAKSVYQTSEIYGPNVAFYKVQDYEQTKEIVNIPRTGLVASIYCTNKETYLRLAEEVRVGLFHWNRPTTSLAYMLPYGGIRQSGNARPMGSMAGLQCTYPLSSLEMMLPFQPESSTYPLPRR